MNAPARLHGVIMAAGSLGMIAGGLVLLFFRDVFGEHSGSLVLVVPWIMAAIAGVNLGYREGCKVAAKRVVPESETDA